MITLLYFTSVNLQAQTSINNCLYIDNVQKYVLSETVVSYDGKKQLVNSLFIWEKDKVIRIVFVYDRKLARLSQARIHQLKSFDSFLPDFRKFIRTDNSCCDMQNNSNKVIIRSSISCYWNFKNLKDDEDNGYNYSIKLKTAINTRNRRVNPLADKFGSYLVSDGDPDVMIPNPRRKDKLINNFPLLINSAIGDSSYIISPLNIDVYRIDKNDIKAEYLKNVSRYKLYSSVSLLEQYIDPQNEKTYFGNRDKDIIVDKIRLYTLPYLYKSRLPSNQDSLLSSLTLMPLSTQKRYVNYVTEITPTPFYPGRDKSKIDSLIKKHKADSIKNEIHQHNNAVSRFFTSYNFDYQYCPECYDLTIPKLDRIRNHCPVKIAMYIYNYDENWSYAFSNKYGHFFKVEKEYQSFNSAPMRTENDRNSWLMMSPGIGYWISDVSKTDRNYIDQVNNLFINGKAIH